MSSSINFFSKQKAFLALIFLLVAGCSARSPYPPLELQAFTADRQSPQPAHIATIRWTAEATGGAGKLSYRFMTTMAGREILAQEGAEPYLDWNPGKEGIYRLRVIVTDVAGNEVDSGWSRPFIIAPPVDERSLLAVLPVENMSGGPAPLAAIAAKLKKTLAGQGVSLLGDEQLQKFMQRYRIRYIGGMNPHTARAIKEEEKVEAALITSLEAYQQSGPPKISLISRLVLSGDKPAVLWMDSVGLTGEDSHGLLGLSRIKKEDVLLEKAIHSLVDSLRRYLAGKPGPGILTSGKEFKGKYEPKRFYRASDFDPNRTYKVAVVPFLNLSERKDAGEIMSSHFVEGLSHSLSFSVIEPGLVRSELLKYRRVMKAGPSLADAELISSESSLGADLILTGKVFNFQSITGIPKVDFSVHVIKSDSREVVWESRSFNHGEEGVYFFDFGRVHAAQELSVEMTRSVLGLFLQ